MQYVFHAGCKNTACEQKSEIALSSFLFAATRETAFVHAISSAGVMYTLTRNCSLGDFDNCGCDDTRNGQRGKYALSEKKTKLHTMTYNSENNTARCYASVSGLDLIPGAHPRNTGHILLVDAFTS